MRKLLASLIAITLLASLASTANATFSTKDSLKNQIAAAGDAVDEANDKVAKALRDYNKAAAALPDGGHAGAVGFCAALGLVDRAITDHGLRCVATLAAQS